MRSKKVHQLRICVGVVGLFFATVAAGGEGLVALQSAEASCADDSGDVYVDCGNGTVTDNRSGLVWLADATCFNEMDWYEAMHLVAGLGAGMCGLSDGSRPSEWRMPTRVELKNMFDTGLGCEPDISNDAGSNCWTVGCVFFGLCSITGLSGLTAQDDFWTAETFGVVANAVVVNATGQKVSTLDKINSRFVWPVRGGQ